MIKICILADFRWSFPTNDQPIGVATEGDLALNYAPSRLRSSRELHKIRLELIHAWRTEAATRHMRHMRSSFEITLSRNMKLLMPDIVPKRPIFLDCSNN